MKASDQEPGHGSFVPDAVPYRAKFVEILEAQHGVTGRRQALTCGITYEQCRWLLSSGRWRQVHGGVYATFTGPMSFEARVWAAILRIGTGAVASHDTAAYLDRICDDPGPVIHITVPAGRHIRVRLPGVQIHYAHRLSRTRHPLRLPPRTRVEETVLDLADSARRASDVESWVTRACQRRLTTPERLAVALHLRKKIRWRPLLEGMLTDVTAGAESPLELQHLRRVERAHGLPPGKRQRRVAGARIIWVDVDHDEYAVRIELDGRVGHVEEGQFRDRRRDNRSTVDGRATLRYGYADVFGDPCGVAAEQARVLAARGWAGTPRPCGPACPVIIDDQWGHSPTHRQ